MRLYVEHGAEPELERVSFWNATVGARRSDWELDALTIGVSRGGGRSNQPVRTASGELS
jgi:hypothetical protein